MAYNPFINKDKVLLIPIPVVHKVGLNAAIILNQLAYWEDKQVGIEREGYRWVYNTYKGWKENFPWWSKKTIQRIFLDLEKKGIIISRQFNSSTWDHKKYYRIDYERLESYQSPSIGTK